MAAANRKSLLILSFTRVVVMLGYGIVLPILPFYRIEKTGFIIARERYIDVCLEACLKDGIEQLVIPRAGYDASSTTEQQRSVRHGAY